MKPLAAALIGMALAAACSSGQETSGDGSPSAILALAAIEPVVLQAGDSAVVSIPVEIQDGFHVQANPAASEFLIPLELKLDPVEGIETGAPVYPPAEPLRLAGTGEDLLTYHGRTTLQLPVRSDTDAGPGEFLLQGSLRYQACNTRTCFAPATISVTFPVTVR